MHLRRYKKFVIVFAGVLLIGLLPMLAFADGTNEPPYGQLRVTIVEPTQGQTFTITFNGNGGTPTSQTQQTDTSGRLADLPTATRAGHTFGGWWTDRTSGTQISASHIFSSDTTLYARWFFVGGGNGGGTRPPRPTPTPTPTPTPPRWYDSGEPLPFVDVNAEDWFYSPVRFVFCRRLMIGMSTEPMTFAPNATVTRDMVVQVLHNIHGRPNANGMVNPFTDVAADRWYANAVIWAADMGLVSGFGDGTFRPSDYITRAHLAIILNNYAERMEIELPILRELVPFADYADIRNYARQAVERFYMATIISGRPGRIFDPQGNATRAEMAAMLQRFLTVTEQ